MTISDSDHHSDRMTLDAGLADIRRSPQDGGALEMIVVRPVTGERRTPASCDVSPEGGVHGDRWADLCWMWLPGGRSHPDVQIAIINARAIALIAGRPERRSLAGDNLVVDLDLSAENLPVGQQLSVGTAVLEITEIAHMPCKKFVGWYGDAAAQFTAGRIGRQNRLRGVYAKVVRAGTIAVGDVAWKI